MPLAREDEQKDILIQIGEYDTSQPLTIFIPPLGLIIIIIIIRLLLIFCSVWVSWIGANKINRKCATTNMSNDDKQGKQEKTIFPSWAGAHPQQETVRTCVRTVIK